VIGGPSDAPQAGRRAEELVIDLRASALELDDVQARLDQLAADLAVLTAAAMSGGDFDEITSLIEASQAVQRAVLSLRVDDAAVA
jgi:hypothetical protein